MSRFEIKKFVELPKSADPSEIYSKKIYMVGRYVGSSFRKVVSFDRIDQAEEFIDRFSGIPDQFCSDFIVYEVTISVQFPDGFSPEFDSLGRLKGSQNRR